VLRIARGDWLELDEKGAKRGMSVLCAHIVRDTNNMHLAVLRGIYMADRKVLVIIRR